MTDYLMQYFSRTRGRGLVFRRDPKGLTLKAYVDGDWLTDYGNDADNRKCCTGYAVTESHSSNNGLPDSPPNQNTTASGQ